MRVNILRSFLLYGLISIAKILCFLESRVSDLLLKTALGVLAVYLVVGNQNSIKTVGLQAGDNIRTVIWYSKLPPDFFDRLAWENRVVVATYLESLKPKPPVKTAVFEFPAVSAKSYIVVDRPSGTVLVSSHADSAFPPASTAKLATALAALKLYSLDEEVTVPQFCTQVDGVRAGLPQGAKFKVGDLLKALLVYSAGDAACTLSIGKSSYADFISLMNSVALELDLQNTRFTNPIGLDDADGENLSSAADLEKLGSVAIQNDFIKEVVSLKEFNLVDSSGKFHEHFTSTNKLLTEVPGSVGIKTGNTTGAGEVLVYEYTRDKVDLSIVVMGSKDRFSDTKLILDWVLRSYAWAN